MMAVQKLAIFDFDGTLCAGNTLHLFMREMACKPGAMRHIWMAAMLRKARLYDSREFKERILRTVAGCSRVELLALGDSLYKAKIRPRLRRGGLEEIKRRSLDGFRIVLVTGAFDFLVTRFCVEHNVQDCLCCRLALDETGCTGRIDGPEMLGADKPGEVKVHFSGQRIDWAQSISFSDDLQDRPLLELTGMRRLIVGVGSAHRWSASSLQDRSIEVLNWD